MSRKGCNVFPVNGIKLLWILSTLILLLAGVVSADTSLQTLRCDSGTTVIGNNGESTNFICTTAGVPLEIGLLGNTTSAVTQYVRIGTASYGPWIYANFINNSAFPSYVNITADYANISMRLGATGSNKRVYGFYELGFYDPDGMPGNFVSLFKSMAASSITTTQTSYSVSFNGQSGIIPAGDKLAVRVWMNSTNVTDRAYFDAYSSTTTGNSSFVINMEPIPTYWLSGYVTDESSGEAITGAIVRINSSVSARTNAFGFYNIPVINGTYTVSASNDTYFAYSTIAAIDGSNVTNVNISILHSSSPAWRILFDPQIDQPSNHSTEFTPKVWLYNQENILLSGQSVTCSYFNVNENVQAPPPCQATDNLDGSYSGTQIDMGLYEHKYINVLFQVNRGAGSNPLKEQHSYYSGESNPAHGAVWKVEVLNTSIGPYFNGSRTQRIYMKFYSDAALPAKNNQITTRYTVKNSSGATTQSGFMTYEEDGIYSFNTNTNYINTENYYFELVSNWSGRPTGSTGTGGTALRNTSAVTGFYLQANNSLSDNVPPEIEAIKRKPYFPVDDELVTVTVDALDNNDITSAHLHYSVNHGLNYSILMVKQAGLEYSAQIPFYLLEDNVRYWIDVEDDTNEVISEEFMYNVQDHRGNANMSHSFLSHPVYWIGKSRQPNFSDYGGIYLNGTYSTSYKDRIAYISTPNDYQYFKDMTRIKVQTLIMDETGKPIQHLTNIRAWLSNNSQQVPGTHNIEKIMTEVPGDPGAYTVTWEGSPDKNYVNATCCFTWSEDSKSIWANYTSGEKYSVFIDADNDSIPEENITWLAYNFGDTMWGAAGITRTFANHSNLESINSCTYGSCHMMVRDIDNRSIPGATCPDCHGVFKEANDSKWPINGTSAEINTILYGNSTDHPRQDLTNTITCGDESCHNWIGSSTNRFPTSNAYIEIPGYPFATRINQTFRSTYPNPMQCAEHHDYKQTKIPVEEGHNKMVGCKYCHGGSHSNFKLKDFDIEAMGTISTVEKGTPGYVGTEGVSGSGTYAGDCYKDCHRVQVEHSLTGMPGGATQNKFVPCDECHENFNNAPMHQESLFPYPDREWCGTCHQVQGNITSHNTSNPLNPPRIPATQQHAQETGIRWNGTGKRPYWVENEQSCRFCHGRSYNQAFGLGRVENFLGTKIINGSINSTSFWCSSCHVNTSSQNYENMVDIYNNSFGVVPPEITGSTWRSDRGGYFDHDETNIIIVSDPGTYNDAKCFSCHGGSLSQSVGLDFLLHDVTQARASPDCISCHNIGGNASRHVNFSAMDNSEVYHRNLNSNASSGGLSDKNKKCWACHGIIVDGYANESDQPQDTHTADWNPRKCPDCHTTGLFNAPNVTDHIPSGYASGTDLKSGAYCSSCHNNSLYESIGIVEVEHENASVSHYGTKKNLIDTIGTINASQGCVYCHLDPINAANWGNASDPRISAKRPHSENRNSQCMVCHIAGPISPTTFHNETLFARVSGGTPPAVPSGSAKILVATNRYVIIDDPITGTAGPGGFANPFYSYPTWTTFTDKNTRINATALFLDDSGSPLSGKIVTFNLYDPSGTEYTAAKIDATTDANGLASFSFDMNARNYYGNWNVKASNGSINDNTGFIYNWIGCAYNSGTCSYNHNSRTFPTGATINSPYTSGRDGIVNSRSTHYGSTVNCTWCHQSYDGTSGDTNPATGDTKHLNVPSDVHRNIACNDVNCHNTLATHRTPGAVIGSCYSPACHTPANRADISNKSTLNSPNIATALSLYSINSTVFNATFHTPNSTIPCIICHGPMHNISKPDETQRFIRNSDTESSQCTTCHVNSSHSQNIAVNCTLCHGSDAHAPEYITNQTTSSVANYSHNRSSAAGCKDCHNNTGINSYFAGKGYDPKKNDSYGYDVTEHNNNVNCNACHDRLHWTGYLNSTGQYQKSSSGSIECLDCHSGTNANISNTNAYWGYITPSRSMHNNSVPCETCHFASKHGIRFLQPDMVSFGSKLTPATCVNCHQQGYPGAPIIPAPVNHSTNSYSGSLWNGIQQPFWDNTSQLSSCNYCHGAELHSTSALGEIEKVKGTNNINQNLTNGYWCANCHYKNTPDYVGNQFTIQPPEVLNLYGLVLSTANDGTSFYNHSNDISSGYDDAKCKTCHDNNLLAGATSLNFTHNVGMGSSGGRNCIACHNISSQGTNQKVNFEVINISVHGYLNQEASSSAEYSANKPCWGCHGTINGTFANESDQPQSGHNISVYKSPRKCDDCHITGRVMFSAKNVTDHISSGQTLETDVNTSSYNSGYCSYCHNNSVNNGFEPDGMGIFGGSPINASVSHYGANKTSNMLMAPGSNSTDCVFCHRNTSNMLAWGILQESPANISNKNVSGGGTDHSQFTSSSQCSACHGGYIKMSEFTFHDGALGNGSGASGGPDCKMCHDVNGAQKKVNFSAMNDADSIHKNLNNEAFASDNAYNESKKCWACHGDGSQPEGHPTQYKTPLKCIDCHINSSAQFAGLQVSRHYWNSSDIKTPASDNCYICHNVTEMIIPAFDPDGKGSVYAGENGGNDSVSHYGKKRQDYQSIQDTNDYCYKCHNNVSTVFPFIDNNNKTIANHSLNYPSTNPDCSDCHSTGRIHDSTLTNPAFSLPNSSFCVTCHGPTGSASIKDKEKHNGTVECSQCHMNSSRSIHPVQYLQQDRTSWNISKTNAVNCTNCHEEGFVNAPIIPDPSKHSNNLSNGSLWNNIPYWISDSGSCYYCHNNTNHNSTALGTISSLLTDLNNTMKGQLTTTTWCVDCHYNDTSNSNYKGDLWSPIPPLINVNNTDKDYWLNHSGYFGSGYKDSVCKNCHTINGNSSLDSMNYSHSLDEGTNGGPDCISCHNIAGSAGAGKLVNFSAMGKAGVIHGNLNINVTTSLSAENKKCWACHGDGSEPKSSGHPTNYKTPFTCDQCHVQGAEQNLNFTPANTLLNVTQHFWNGTSIGTAAITSCYVCHNTSEMMLGTNLDPDGAGSVYGGANGGSDSTSHYGKKRPDYQSIQDTNDYCYSCHNNSSIVFPFIDNNNKTIANHSVNYPSTNPNCVDCHSTGRIHDPTLSNPKFSLPNSSFCITCHGPAGSASIKDKEKHNGSLDCTQCHLNSSRNIHPVQYLQQDTSSWDTSRTNAVNCTDCHRSGFANAPIIPDPSRHSNNLSNGSLWNNTAYWITGSGSCYYCHNNTNHNSTAIGTISVLLTNPNNIRKGQLTTTTWCADCHYNDVLNPFYKGDQWNPIPPLITVNNTDKDYWLNHTGYLGSGFEDNVCESCHAINGNSSLDSMNYSHSLSEGTNGGPDCISCHDIGGSAGTGKLVNLSAMGNSGAIHSNLNNNATTSLSAENKKCWACHGNGNEPEASGHPTNYRTPFNCDECHVQGADKNLNFTPTNTLLNVTEHFWNGTSIGTAAITTCYGCHNTSEMMLGTNLDPDGAGSVYGGVNGGNASSSHYGKKRPDYQLIQNTNDYCTRCHNNISTLFPFMDISNKTISNHSVNYPSTNPDCADCHLTGRIHDNTLANPKFGLPNSSYCLTCHGPAGSASIKDKEKHNGSVDCTKCHLNSSRNIHPVQYLQQDTTSWNTSKTNAVNCTDCHRSGFANAPIIPDPAKHSNNLSNGSIWNNTAYWANGSGSCYYCHNNTNHNSTAMGRISILQTNPNNTRKGQLTTTTWCADCHYNDVLNPFYKGDQWNPIPPLITVNNTNKEYWINHTSYVGTGYSDIVCENCHAMNGISTLDSSNYSHSLNEGKVGGPDCISCHSTAMGGGKQINLTAMNNSEAIHKNLNSNSSNFGLSDENKKCWACHSNGSPPAFGHPSNFRTPYKCDQCHVPGPGQNLNFNPENTLSNVTEHYWNGTNIGTSAITTCYGCHNTSEMMLGENLDPDGAGSVYGGVNGGNASSSHYGKKRPDYQLIQNSNDYCTRCHNNISTVFPFADSNNKTIGNHSVNYPVSNPNCADCHLTGRIHDNTLANPKFGLPNSSYCLTCHGPAGSASIKDKEKHNGSVDCTQCHLNSSRNIHPVQYLQKDTSTWDTSKTNAVNCTDCHRSGFADAPIIPDPAKHSNNLSNGSLWNITAYWTNGSGSCYYCHNNTNHNSTAIGTISVLLTNPNNIRKGQLTTTTWCADCHYSDVSNTNYKGNQWEPIPPLINKDNTNKDGWLNHSGYFGTGYTDSSCESCHAFNGSSSKDSMNYSHSLNAGMGGGPDCISCHDIGGLAPVTVNVTDLGKGIHMNLNGASSNANLSCYACHGDGSAPASGHPVEYKNPKKCADCHSQGNYSAQVIQNHIPPKLANDPGRTISTNAYCTDCHNNSINNFAYSINGSVSHYGTNTSILKPTVNQTVLPVSGFFDITEAQEHNKECNNCHKNYPFNLTYGNATQTEYGHTSTASCDQCHLKASASDLHNGSLIMPDTFSCLECHTSNASKYKAPNITGTSMGTYSNASCENIGCHGQGNANGLLDTLNKHNFNVNFSGTPGNTGTVYIDGKRSVTVNNGTQVLISSVVNDISGVIYYASRVGGAEYYIDLDPGVGKGIALNPEDGYYDAVNGAWENVTGTIDTANLSAGIHTVYVRGMDIGKQWSPSQNASLTIKSSISYVPSAPVSLESVQGNFWINYTWHAGNGNITESFNVSVNESWTNGTILNYSNNSVGPHGWSNISVLAFNNSGNGSLSLVAASNNTQVANNNPVQAQIGNKTVAEGNLLTFSVQATDIESDLLVNGTNATKGTFDPVTNQFTWTPGYGDQGIYFWNFNSSDNYGGTTGQTIKITINNVPLSITTSNPVTDPTSTESANQAFTINLNRTSNVTWYMNGSIVKINTSVTFSNYANSTAGIGVYNVTAIASDGFDTTTRKWNWTVTAIPTYQVSGYAFDNYGIGLRDVQVQNATNQDSTSSSGQYSITGLINATYNFSFTKIGFDTGYLEVTINGADITNANNTIFDNTPPGQVTGLINDTPALTTVNLSWDPTADANFYQVFRNTSTLGYTRNTYWNDTGLNSTTIYEYIVRANDTYDNWGQNSSLLDVTTATPDTTAPASISDINLITGNFFINNTWVNPSDIDLDYIWFRNSNGTTLQNVSKPANYLNLSYSVRYTQNISAQTVDTMGNINQTQIWFNTTIPNNPPVQLLIGSKIINENQLLQFTVTSTDADNDLIIYGTNATNGTFNTSTGEFTWMPVFGEAGIYVWYFNSSDSYGGNANETITVTVNADPLSNCLSCHNSTQGIYPAIIQQSFGKHFNVDTAEGFGILNNRDCLQCHYNITNMYLPEPTKTRTCTDCHTQGNFSAPVISNHRPGGVNISTTANCSTCHNNSISVFAFNSNTSTAHYSTNSSLIKPTVNRTVMPVFGFMTQGEASQYNKECNNCHATSNSSYGNATNITLGHTSTGVCNQCHLKADASDLHNGSLTMPINSSCIFCHMTNASAYNAPNLSNTLHKNYDCSYNCHQTDYGRPGIFDPEDHNTDFTNSPGLKPSTDPVSLNGASSLTVPRGETVTISSQIKDASIATASRVRGAEYYIDSEPGLGKGTTMSATDGYFDASNAEWENITGSIDTLKLTPGTHTVYVRGMDIGKQWSTSVAATLIILDSNGFVNGTVRNSSGSLIAGATIITNTGVSSITDSNGFYSLDLMIGIYDLSAIKEPEFYANNTFASVNITNSAIEIREAVLTEKPTGTISGSIKNS